MLKLDKQIGGTIFRPFLAVNKAPEKTRKITLV